MKTSLAKVRGLGSAKSGTHHWWMQRVTAIALLPLSIWLLVSVVILGDADHATFVAWAKMPLATVLLCLFTYSAFYHLKLGLQVIIEDYVHTESTKHISLILINFIIYGAGLTAIIALLKISFGS